ncbi:inner centromere protein isoform X2 [Trichosurus vulpecula]|uniref:inner centromere protein isoform X2 n=1 Tax=Trichosurus vulpecula TaxID=9337 RepID=UPI00186AFB79|nr:inner centromere protein isoform X2 [Trichosurus vulpecula]
MGTTRGSASILEVCNTKLMEFMCNVENKDMVWLQEIKEEALKMFSSDFSVEPELMPKTPSQRNRRKKKRFSSIQDENRPPTRKRLSRRASRRSSQHNRQLLRSKDRLDKLVLVAAENGSIPRTRSQAAAAPSPPESPTVLPKKSGNLLSAGKLMPVVEISASEQRSAEKCLVASKAGMADQKLSFVLNLGCEDESMPKKQAESLPKPVSGTSSVLPPEVPEMKARRPAQSVAKLRIAQPASPEDAAPVVTEPDRVPSSAGTQPQPETEPLLDLPESPRTPTGSRRDRRSVRRSLVRKSSQAHRVSLIHKYSMVPKKISPARRSSRKLAREPAATGRIICHSYLERLLDIEVPRNASSEEEAECATETEQEAPEGTRRTLRPRNVHKIAISTPKPQPESGSQADGDGESKTDQGEEPREPPQSVRRKRSYKQAVSEPGDTGDHMDDEALTPPRTKTPSPVCPPSKVVRPLRTFLHTVQKNQMLMTPTSAGRTSVMKSFIKRNTPHHMDAKGSFVEKERQRLENLKKKEEAELLRKQKVEEDKRRRLEEVKMKREERLRKVLQARERAEQLEVEKKKRIEQKLAQLERNEKAKEERLAEEKARKKAAKKLEEAEMKRKQEEEARRQKKLQQEEEERRYQEKLQKKKEEEQERLRKVAEARRIVEQQKQREQQLALEREMERKREQERLQAERERALRLQKEKELEEKRKREECQRQEQERKKLQEEQEKKAKEAVATAGANNKFLNVTVDVQSPVCNSYEMTPQGPKGGPKINPDNYGMDLNSDDSTDDETQPRKPIPAWANGSRLSQAVIHQYYQPPDIDQLFGTILSPKLEDIFNKSKPRYHKRTSSAVWHSPPLLGARSFVGLSYGLKKP